MEEKPRTTPYPLRMPDELRAKLEDAAKKGARSLHAEIVARLQSSFVRYADAEFHSVGKSQANFAGDPPGRPGLPPELRAELERLFDEKLGQRAYIDDGKGGRTEDLELPKKKGPR